MAFSNFKRTLLGAALIVGINTYSAYSHAAEVTEPTLSYAPTHVVYTAVATAVLPAHYQINHSNNLSSMESMAPSNSSCLS
ncbi:hypothetical protein [Thiofilum flexile]|uniref:hypothetical protein n=1 Tax=Thiofilum flexile TaxID=125627 RepID=UPI00036E7063|nr:hypothetical protein [Thiofilum flexile]